MRKLLLKTIVATAVVGATLALTSVLAMAETYTKTYTFGTNNADLATDSKDFFTIPTTNITSAAEYAAISQKETINFFLPIDATNVKIKSKIASGTTSKAIKINSTTEVNKTSSTADEIVEKETVLAAGKYNTGASNVNTIGTTATNNAINWYYITVTYDSEGAVEIEQTDIPAGEYTAAAIEANADGYFTGSTLTQSGASGKYKSGSKLSIKLADTATVTINARSGSGDVGTSKYADFKLNGTTYRILPGKDAANYSFYNVPAGVQELEMTNNGTSNQLAKVTITYEETSENNFAAFYSDDTNYYAVVKVSAEEAAAGLPVNLTYKDTVLATSSTVYESVKLNETQTIDAPEGFYLFGTKIPKTGLDENITAANVETVIKAIKKEF